MAILLVMLFHLSATHDWFPGGSLGVDIFFVLSGFLITTILLEERSRSGAISLPHFFQRRARRLLPALVVFLAVFAIVTVVLAQPGTGRLPATLLATVFYAFNWVAVLGAEWTPGVGHLWSLSVEEQFYLIWPFIVIVALRSGPGRLLVVSLLIFVVSAWLHVWSTRSSGQLYFSTDFRAQELVAGALLAQLRFRGVLGPSIVRTMPFRIALSLSLLFFFVFALPIQHQRGIFVFGFFTLAAAASTVLVCAGLYSPPRILTNRLIRYLGTRSYALYLWHNAVFYWMGGLEPVPGAALSLLASFAAAELSWQLVERRGSHAAQLLNRIRERFTCNSSFARERRPIPAQPLTSEPQQ